MGRVRVRGSGQAGSTKTAPAPPGGGAEIRTTSRLAAGQGSWSCCRRLRLGGWRVVRGLGQAADLAVAQAVVGQGEEAAAAATLAMLRASLPRRAMMAALAAPAGVAGPFFWMASMTAQRSILEPCLVTCPRFTLTSDSRCLGVSPAHEHSWAAVLNQVTSPISAMMIAARTGPMPGSCWITW